MYYFYLRAWQIDTFIIILFIFNRATISAMFLMEVQSFFAVKYNIQKIVWYNTNYN